MLLHPAEATIACFRHLRANPVVVAPNPDSLVSIVLQGAMTLHAASTPAQFASVASQAANVAGSWARRNVSTVGVPGTLLGMIEPTLHDTDVDLSFDDVVEKLAT